MKLFEYYLVTNYKLPTFKLRSRFDDNLGFVIGLLFVNNS